jgi:hypothetical protein
VTINDPETNEAKHIFTHTEFKEVTEWCPKRLPFINTRVGTLAIHCSALHEQAWDVLRMARRAVEGARLEFYYNREDFDSRASLRKDLEYVILPFFNECPQLSLHGPNLPFTARSDPLGLFSLVRSPEMPRLLIHTDKDQEDAVPMVSVEEVVEWIEDWKAPISVDWGDISEKCVFIGAESLSGAREELISRLSEVGVGMGTSQWEGGLAVG